MISTGERGHTWVIPGSYLGPTFTDRGHTLHTFYLKYRYSINQVGKRAGADVRRKPVKSAPLHIKCDPSMTQPGPKSAPRQERKPKRGIIFEWSDFNHFHTGVTHGQRVETVMNYRWGG